MLSVMIRRYWLETLLPLAATIGVAAWLWHLNTTPEIGPTARALEKWYLAEVERRFGERLGGEEILLSPSFRQLGTDIQDIPSFLHDRPGGSVAWDDVLYAEWRTRLAPVVEGLVELAERGVIAQPRPAIDPSDGGRTVELANDFPTVLANVASHLLCREALNLWEQGEIERAVSRLELGGRLFDAAAHGTLGVDSLMRAEVARMKVSRVADSILAAHPEASPADLRQLQQVLVRLRESTPQRTDLHFVCDWLALDGPFSRNLQGELTDEESFRKLVEWQLHLVASYGKNATVDDGSTRDVSIRFGPPPWLQQCTILAYLDRSEARENSRLWLDVMRQSGIDNFDPRLVRALRFPRVPLLLHSERAIREVESRLEARIRALEHGAPVDGALPSSP